MIAAAPAAASLGQAPVNNHTRAHQSRRVSGLSAGISGFRTCVFLLVAGNRHATVVRAVLRIM